VDGPAPDPRRASSPSDRAGTKSGGSFADPTGIQTEEKDMSHRRSAAIGCAAILAALHLSASAFTGTATVEP
jgi:hypothetical protein